MVRGGVLPLILAAIAGAALCVPALPQEDGGKPVPPAKLRAPFPIDVQEPKADLTISFRPAGEMTEQDKLLEADSESAISERAGFTDLQFNQGPWTYTQIVCPALPNHLFLRFKRNEGVGDVSLFSASIPRNGEGRVRIIPIRRRGYSLFSPAPINALTISAFNHILTEERADRVPDWAGMAVCYAALAGAHPAVEQPSEIRDGDRYMGAPNVSMNIPPKGGAVIRFTDVAVPQKPMEWTLTFNLKGRLLKASHVPAPAMTARAVLPAAKIEARPVPPPK